MYLFCFTKLCTKSGCNLHELVRPPYEFCQIRTTFSIYKYNSLCVGRKEEDKGDSILMGDLMYEF